MQERIFHQGIVPIDNLSKDQCFLEIKSILDEKRNDQQIITLSPKCYLAALESQEFLEVLNADALVIPESTMLRFYSFVKPPFLVRVAGINILNQVLNECSQKHMKIALLGSSEKNRNLAQQNIQLKYPNLQVKTIQGDYSFGSEDDSRMIVEGVHDISPNFVVVVAGNQVESELWISRRLLRKGLNINLVGNFGQAIDLLSGVRHDFKVARKFGIEWFMRILFESSDFRKERTEIFVAFSRMILFGKTDNFSKRKSGKF